MSSGGSTFQRARSQEQKQQRRAAILASASALALRHGVRAVTVTDIAQDVGIHKSAVLRYFETREDVYLTLTADGWRDWADALVKELPTDTNGPARPAGTPPSRPARLAEALAGTLAERPLFCELLAHASLNLERNVSMDTVRAFKLTALAAASDIAARCAHTVPELDERRSWDVIAGVVAMAAALWQTAHPPETLASLYRADPRLRPASADFAPRLRRLTLALIIGLTSDFATDER